MKKLLFLIVVSVISATAESLTLSEALARVEASHPWLRDRTPLTALAASRATVAAAKAPAEVSLQLENALGTGELRAAQSLETTLEFSRALDWAGRRAARIDAARALSETERAAWEERRLDLLAETARRFILVAAAQASLATTKEQLELSRETVAAVEARHAKAAATAGDISRARLAMSEAQLAAEHAEHNLLSARLNLATLWGATTADFEETAADLTPLPAVPAFEQLSTRLLTTPAQARFIALTRWRDAEERLAGSTGARGDTRWSAGLRRNEASADFGLVAGVSYEWPVKNVASARAAESRAERDRTVADSEAALLESQATLHGLWQELHHAQIEHDMARNEMIPAAKTWMAGVEAGLVAGRFDMRELLEARAALFNARRRQTQAAADYHLTLVAMEQLLGTTVNP